MLKQAGGFVSDRLDENPLDLNSPDPALWGHLGVLSRLMKLFKTETRLCITFSIALLSIRNRGLLIFLVSENIHRRWTVNGF